MAFHRLQASKKLSFCLLGALPTAIEHKSRAPDLQPCANLGNVGAFHYVFNIAQTDVTAWFDNELRIVISSAL